MPRPDVVLDGWTWSPSIGLYYGRGPQGEFEQIAQPLMTSPWWVVCSEHQRAMPDDRTGEPGEGTFVRIFPGPKAAARFVSQRAEVGAA